MTTQNKGKPRGVVSLRTRIDYEAGQEVMDALARELLGVCMATLGSYGVNARRLAELASEAIATHGDIPTASKMFQDTERLGDLANEWTESPQYVDASGRPKVLPIMGKGLSFTTLARRHFAGCSADNILELGCRTRVLERVGRDKVALFGGCVMFTGSPALMLVHAIHSIRWFLTTTLTNAGSHISSVDALPDRRACAVVPEEDLPEFINVMRQPVITLIEMGNRWLAARAGRKRAGKLIKGVTMGVHAFLFRDQEKD